MRPIPLPVRIALGLAIGAALGVAAQAFATAGAVGWVSDNIAAPVGGVFLNLMFMVIIPLIFSSLALGVAGLGDLKTVGRLGAKILVGTVVLTGASVFIGLSLVNIVRPGEGIDPAARVALEAKTSGGEVEAKLDLAKQKKSFARVLIDSISRNPLEDAANLFNPNPNYKGGGIIAFMVFTMIVGIALTAVGAETAAPMVKLLESIQALSMAVIGFAMWLAPFGVAALIFQTTSKIGLSIFGVLFKYVAVVIGGLLIQMLLTYSVVLWGVARRSPWKFFAAMEEVIITAFSTSSSNATLPTSLRVAGEKIGLPTNISSFVLTVGSTANQNGTALFEGVTILFLAQFYGVHLDFAAQTTVVLMSILAGIGTAGVPGGSIPLIALVLQSVGIPAAGIGVILGVDRLLDMCRTVVNVVGDMVLAVAVSGDGKAKG